MKRPTQAQAQVFKAQFKLALNYTTALCNTCKGNTNTYTYAELATLLNPLVDRLGMLGVLVDNTHVALFVGRMNCYVSMLKLVLMENNNSAKAYNLPVLLNPVLSGLKALIQEYEVDSHKVASTTSSQDKTAGQKEPGAELVEPLPTQEPPIRDGLVITTPPENILELIEASLTGNPDDICTEYQAGLPADLTQEEVEIAYDSFMVMLEHFIQ